MIIKQVDCYGGKYKSNEIECEDDCIQHRVLKIVLKHNDDGIKRLIKKVRDKVFNIKFNEADSSGKKRTEKELKLKSICGLLAEQILYLLLKKFNKKINTTNDKNINIILDDSTSSINQIDIQIQKSWKNQNNTIDTKIETVEIRSSFPFYNIESSVCKNFDVLGPYINDVKILENEKDYYLRLLFELDYNETNYYKYKDKNDIERVNYNKTTLNTLSNDYFDDNFELKKDLVVYFVGGATKQMMRDESISYIGSMESDIFNTNQNGKFKKIKLNKSLDSISILRIMINVCNTEQIEGK